RSLAEPNPIKAIRIEPCAMHTGDSAIKVGDASYHRRPGLGRQVLIGAIIAAWVEAQAATMVHVGYSSTLQVSRNDGTVDRTRDRKQPSSGLLRSGRHGRTTWLCDKYRFIAWQFQKAPRLLGDLAKVTKPEASADNVEEIAMLACRGIGPLTSGPFRRFLEPHEHRAARGIVDVANKPISPLALAIGKVVTTHRFGLARETVRQL